MMLPRPNPRVLSRWLGDELVLVHLDTNQIYSLNATGARFWELLGETSERSEVESVLHADFDVPDDVLSAEIDRVLGELRALDLVQEP